MTAGVWMGLALAAGAWIEVALAVGAWIEVTLAGFNWGMAKLMDGLRDKVTRMEPSGRTTALHWVSLGAVVGAWSTSGLDKGGAGGAWEMVLGAGVGGT